MYKYLLVYKDNVSKQILTKEFNFFEDVSNFVENHLGNCSSENNDDLEFISVVRINLE